MSAKDGNLTFGDPEFGETLGPIDLALIMAALPVDQPITDEHEGRIPGVGYPGGGHTWYTSQKEHVVGWLWEYQGPGAYGREGHEGTARQFYNRFQCAAGLLWLAEALGEDKATLRGGSAAIKNAGPKTSAQAGAFRKVVPWQRIKELIAARAPF